MLVCDLCLLNLVILVVSGLSRVLGTLGRILLSYPMHMYSRLRSLRQEQVHVHYKKLVKERGWKTVELNVIGRRTYHKNVCLPTNIADGDFWTNLKK
jgi:hypothetical protein